MAFLIRLDMSDLEVLLCHSERSASIQFATLDHKSNYKLCHPAMWENGGSLWIAQEHTGNTSSILPTVSAKSSYAVQLSIHGAIETEDSAAPALYEQRDKRRSRHWNDRTSFPKKKMVWPLPTRSCP